jgi:uncharacterized protein
MYSWGHNRRFNSYTEYFKTIFGERVQKISLDAGFTCPNRDGSKGFGGCSYCNNNSFSPSYCKPEKTVAQQIEEGIEFHKFRYRRADKFLAYFQAYSNTYKDIESLKAIYETAKQQGIVGFVIGTRPDCIDDEKLDYFAQLAKDYYVIIEYGIESCNDRTLERVNRGHNFATTIDAITRTAERGINVGGHLLFGLPGETKDEMLQQANIISQLPLNTIKFHQLQIIKGTRFEQEYKANPDEFSLFEMSEYIDFIVQFTERLNPKIVIERFSSESPPRYVVAPEWGLIRYDEILRLIEKKMEIMDTWQGRLFEK